MNRKWRYRLFFLSFGFLLTGGGLAYLWWGGWLMARWFVIEDGGPDPDWIQFPRSKTGQRVVFYAKRQDRKTWVLHGPCTYYLRDGRRRSQITYRNGKRDGEYLRWYPSGGLERRVGYLDGEAHGEIRYWFENGRLAYRANYSHGEFQGESITWHRNGQVASYKRYRNSYVVGLYIGWNRDGEITELYDRGVSGGQQIKLDPRAVDLAKLCEEHGIDLTMVQTQQKITVE